LLPTTATLSHLRALFFLNLEVCPKLLFSGGGVFESELEINIDLSKARNKKAILFLKI
jgi:hypothetical protein